MIRVYHNAKFLDCGLTVHIPEIEDLTLVAVVDTNDLEEAYKLTNHIDHKWWLNNEVVKVKESRSTSVGDIMVRNGKTYQVCTFSFTELSDYKTDCLLKHSR